MGVVTLQPPPRLPQPRKVRSLEPSFHLIEVRTGYHPGWSLALSALGHSAVWIAILLLSFVPVAIRRPQIAEVQKVDLRPVQDHLYLPTLGGGSEGAGHAGGASGSASEASPGLRARSRRGFAYPGPQPLISNPPKATLGMQTILQPSLPNPPLFQQYLPLPNIVRPEAPAKQPALVVKSERPVVHASAKAVAAPRISLPSGANPAIPDLASSEPAPAKPNLARPEVSNVPMARSNEKSLLVLNAVPAPAETGAKIPLAESRSLFAVVPGEGTIIADPGAGARAGGSSSSTAGSGTTADVATGDALAEGTGGGSGTGKGSAGTGTGTGHAGNGAGSGLNTADSGTGSGRGTGSGSGTGTGPGTSVGSGSGAGSAPGSGGFPGITIRGGQYGNNASTSMHVAISPRTHAYNMTVVSTASSGGGLPDFGVFSNEKVYTVYLDMSAGPDDPAPSWTLQYAPIQHAASGGQLKAPYVLLKEIPQLPAELAQKCAHKLIVVSGVLNQDGKLEKIAMQQTPDSRVAAPLIEALSNWMFKPAELDGQKVSLKVLLGIRLLAGK